MIANLKNSSNGQESCNFPDLTKIEAPIQPVDINTNATFELIRAIDTPLKNPSEFDLESGSETWIETIKISQGRKIQRVWKSIQPDPWNLDCVPITKSSEAKITEPEARPNEKSADEPRPQGVQENGPEGPLRSLKYQKWFKTPDFTLKKKLSEMESSMDTTSDNLATLGTRLSRLSFSDVPSNTCITRTKLDPADISSVEDFEFNTPEKINLPNYQPCSDENGNPLKIFDGTKSELALEKSEQIRKWISPHDNTTLHPFGESPGASYEISPDQKKPSGLNLQNFAIVGRPTEDDQATKEAVDKTSKASLTGRFEIHSRFHAHVAKFIDSPDLNSQERSASPLLHSARKISKHFHSTKNSSKSPQLVERSGQATGLGLPLPDQDLMSNFKDISFHYRSDDSNLDNLIPTGFSFNFEYPSGIVAKHFNQYSGGQVSSYFPGSTPKKVSATILNTESATPVPEHLINVQETVVNSGPNNQAVEQDKMKSVTDYKIETIKFPTPCRLPSNVSMLPLIHSEATVGSMTPSQYDLLHSGFYSDNGNSLPSTGVGKRRRPRSVRNIPHSGDTSEEMERRLLNLYNEVSYMLQFMQEYTSYVIKN